MDCTTKLVKARKAYWCTECGLRLIGPGDRYLYAACPPWHEVNSSKKWWVIRACLRCADREGLHTAETRALAAGPEPAAPAITPRIPDPPGQITFGEEV